MAAPTALVFPDRMWCQPMIHEHSIVDRPISQLPASTTQCVQKKLSSTQQVSNSRSSEWVTSEIIPLSHLSLSSLHTNPVILTILPNIRKVVSPRSVCAKCSVQLNAPHSRPGSKTTLTCPIVILIISLRLFLLHQVTYELMCTTGIIGSRHPCSLKFEVHTSSSSSPPTFSTSGPVFTTGTSKHPTHRAKSSRTDCILTFGFLHSYSYRFSRFGSGSSFAQLISMFFILSYGLTITHADRLSSMSGVNIISREPDRNPVPDRPPSDSKSAWSDQIKAHCVDSNGTLHGLFSTWTEYPECHCTCYPNSRLAVSICDGCEPNTHGSKAVASAERKPIARSGDRYDRRQSDVKHEVAKPAGPRIMDRPVLDNQDEEDLEMEEAGEQNTLKHRGCMYQLTGSHYRHGEIWMSAEMPCVKCHCQDGTISCTGEPHHCPPLCLPGQQTTGPGVCCETTCKGTRMLSIILKNGFSYPRFLTLVCKRF